MKRTSKMMICLVLMAIIASSGFAQRIVKAVDKKGNLYLEKNGKRVVKENFEKIASYEPKAELIPAKLNGKWGFYDNDGKLVIPHLYDTMIFESAADLIGWYVQERMQVTQNGKTIFIDKTGKEISPPEYDDIVEVPYTGAGYYLKKGGKWALGDMSKKPLTDFKYDRILGPISISPLAFKGIRDGQEFRLNSNGIEEETMNSSGSSSNQSKENGQKKDVNKYKYVCQGCGQVQIMEGADRPSSNKTRCSSPKIKNSTSHSWDRIGKVN